MKLLSALRAFTPAVNQYLQFPLAFSTQAPLRPDYRLYIGLAPSPPAPFIGPNPGLACRTMLGGPPMPFGARPLFAVPGLGRGGAPALLK